MYTVFPGELSASVGGNVGTNAGGMRAVEYGVTRHNMLGLEAALPTGVLIRTGGKIRGDLALSTRTCMNNRGRIEPTSARFPHLRRRIGAASL